MLSRLADFLHANARRVLFAAVIVAAVAGVFGTGVAKHMSPYGASRAAGVPIHLPAVFAVLPLARRLAAAAISRRTGDRGHVLRLANRRELRRSVRVRAQLRHGHGAWAGDRLQPVHGLALPRGG